MLNIHEKPARNEWLTYVLQFALALTKTLLFLAGSFYVYGIRLFPVAEPMLHVKVVAQLILTTFPMILLPGVCFKVVDFWKTRQGSWVVWYLYVALVFIAMTLCFLVHVFQSSSPVVPGSLLSLCSITSVSYTVWEAFRLLIQRKGGK